MRGNGLPLRAEIDDLALYVSYGSRRLLRKPSPALRFALYTSGRSGSSLLVDLLDRHPNICCDGEILACKPRFPLLHVNAMASRVGGASVAYGFKVLTYQLFETKHVARSAGLLSRLVDESWTLIHLHRNNLLRQALSNVLARKSVFHHRREEGEWNFEPATVDPGEVQQWLEFCIAYERDESRLLGALPRLDVVYERDLCDVHSQQATADRITAAMGLPRAVVATDFVRLTPDRLADAIANYEEVAAVLMRTPHRARVEEWLES